MAVSKPSERAFHDRRPEQKLVERRQRLLGSAYRLFYRDPVYVARGEGVWLFDREGRAYLDAYNNVPCIGHCHPHVAEALANQARVLNTHTRYLSDGILEYAERLLALFPSTLGNVMFTCSGSEANDLAYRIARTATDATGFIVTSHAYHGGTVAISELSPSLGSGVPLAPTTRTVPAPDAYRSHGGDAGKSFGSAVTSAVAELVDQGIRPAALILDSLFSSDGIFPDPAGLLRPAVDAIHEAGGLFIADEVQAGFGRTGAGMWGFSRHEVIPDIVTLGKPMGGGHPLAGLVARPDLVETFGQRSRYFNTFGGNPVSCAVGMAVLDVIESEGLVANARDVGAGLVRGLLELAQRYEFIGDVRAAGLFVGVEIVADRETKDPDSALTTHVVEALRQRRILVSSTGPHANVLKIRPPLVFSSEHASLLLSALEQVLADESKAR